MLLDFIYISLAFLLGSIPTGYLLTKYSGRGDIREVGSGNIGATNVLRNSGKLLGLLTLLLDIAKGFFALYLWDPIEYFWHLNYYISPIVLFGDLIQPYAVIGSAVVLGHIFSPWLKYKGGKGVATMVGVILCISLIYDNSIFLITIFTWLMIIFFTRYVALGSVISLIIATIYSFIFLNGLFPFFIFMTLLITYKHKDNFERIRNKTEHKISF